VGKGGWKLKIAITSTGADMEADVDPRFGRAKYLILYDTDAGAFSALDNSEAVNATQGAGIQAGQNIANAGVEALITGNCGPKAFSVLSSAGVKVYIGASGTVREALDAYQAGTLTPANAPNVQGHW
jgi:predicted Fe-Mo cluster-binding NifX family protein